MILRLPWFCPLWQPVSPLAFLLPIFSSLLVLLGARELAGAGVLLEQDHAAGAAADVRLAVERDVDLDDLGGETTHLCAMDADGGAVSMTLSIERSFGSSCMAPSLGFLLNGYLRGFKIKARRHPHYLRPGAPARSNAAPSLVQGPGDELVAIGSTGSERMVETFLWPE